MKAPLSPAIGGGLTRPHPDQLRPRPHWVYRLYDEDNELLYVGCTYLEPRERIAAVRQNRADLRRVPVHHWHAHQYRNMTEALAVEGMWIDLFGPPLNGMRSGVAARRELVDVPTPIDHTYGFVPASWAERAVSA